MPATDEEVMEVEDLIEDDKCEIQFVADTKQQAECVSDNVFSSGKSQSNGPEGQF